MQRLLFIAILAAAVAFPCGCKKKYRNLVPIDQIEADSSNNYNFIFKKAIEEENKRDGRFKKNEFRD